jgi:hypothetical protein
MSRFLLLSGVRSQQGLLLLRFFPSKAKAIGDRVIAEELNGTVYDEEDAKHWSINVSDKIREAVTGN